MAFIDASRRENDICVFVGRFQPTHAAHVAVILKALELAEYVIIVVGSAHQPRRPDANPFLFHERNQMLLAALPKEVHERIIIVPMADSNYDTNSWNASVFRAVDAKVKVLGLRHPQIALIGHAKDHTSFYLKLFPQWLSINVPMVRTLDATTIRDGYLSRDPSVVEAMFKQALDREDLPVGVHNWLRDFQKTDIYGELVDEMEYYRSCHARWARESFPGARNTVTADPVIIQASHILLIQRGQYPQKGTWALPGGHVETNETIADAALREGYEETGIKVPKVIFEKSFVAQDYFDAPRRDPRGRYVGHAFMYHLQPTVPQYDHSKTADWNRARVEAALDLPKVKGMDDAAHAKWVHLSQLNPEEMFLDHYAIIKKMIAKLPGEQ